MKLDILINQKGHPRRGHHTHHARQQTAIKPAQPFLAPNPLNHIPRAAPKPFVRLVVLQAATHDLVWVGCSAGDELGTAGKDDGGLGPHGLCGAVDAAPAQPAGVVGTLEGLVDGELHCAVRDANEGDGEAAVEAHDTFGA